MEIKIIFRVSCCPKLVEENDAIKRLKPILYVGIIVYVVLLFLDIFYLKTNNMTTYILLIVFLSLLSFKQCFLVFPMFTIISIILICGSYLPNVGVIAQNKFFNGGDIILKFCIYIFGIIFTIVLFYFSFIVYKEIRALIINGVGNGPQLIAGYPNENNPNIVRNNNNNNNNQNKSGGFKAFSGKGYRVG